MFKTYMRLLGFARPIKKYAIPYFFYSLFYALFNSLTFMLIIPILNTMFDANYSFESSKSCLPWNSIRTTSQHFSTSPIRTSSNNTTARTY